MSASPNNPHLGFHWHVPPGNMAPPVLMPPVDSGHEALQALLAFSALHDQVRRQTEVGSAVESGKIEKFVLDEVLQLVADRALALTGANGVAIALAEGNEIICRASSGTIAPDKRAKLNPNSGFSGACFRTAQIVRCDDTENDPRVNVQAARRLGTRSMVAVPLVGKNGPIGLIEAFSNKAYAFQDGSIRSLNLLAELILAAMKPEEGKVETPQPALVKVEMPEPQATIADPVEEISPEIKTEVITEAATETAIPDFVPNFAIEKPSAPPGLKIVVALVLLAIAMGAGIWWKLHTSQPTATNHLAAPPVITQSAPFQSAAVTAPSETSSDSEKEEGPVVILGVRNWSSASSSTIVIDLQDQVQQYERHDLTGPDRIYFDLHDTTVSQSITGKTEVGDSPWLMRVRIAQPTPGTTRVVLDTKNSPECTVSVKSDPHRLEVQLHGANTASQPKAKVDLFAPLVVASATSAAKLPRTPEMDDRAPVKSHPAKFKIALDAGHGGWDEGTIGRRGLMEKDIALDIVARVGKLVTERLGGEVVYTRRDDTYIPLEKRAEIANMAQADFFVSVHANYSDTPSARGVETYYSNSYSSLNARIPGSDETVQQVNWTNVDIREKALQSQKLASSVQNALYEQVSKETSGVTDRGIKKAPYVVLTGTTMPAILAEVAFVSSPADEKSLKSSAYRQRIALALYKGIARFVATQHKLTLASAGAKPGVR